MTIIGRKEFIEIPLLQDECFVAKIDTGAYSNSMHCDDVYIDADGVVITIKDIKVLHIPHGMFKHRKVKSSNGQIEKRVTTVLPIIFNNKKYRTTFTFTNRENMKSMVLLGRKFLSKRYIVDVSKTNTLKIRKGK